MATRVPGVGQLAPVTERDDFSRGFVSDDERTRNRTVAAAINAVEQQEIGAAEARRTNPDERFAGPGDRGGRVEDFQIADARRRLDQRAHVIATSAAAGRRKEGHALVAGL